MTMLRLRVFLGVATALALSLGAVVAAGWETRSAAPAPEAIE